MLSWSSCSAWGGGAKWRSSDNRGARGGGVGGECAILVSKWCKRCQWCECKIIRIAKLSNPSTHPPPAHRKSPHQDARAGRAPKPTDTDTDTNTNTDTDINGDTSTNTDTILLIRILTTTPKPLNRCRKRLTLNPKTLKNLTLTTLNRRL